MNHDANKVNFELTDLINWYLETGLQPEDATIYHDVLHMITGIPTSVRGEAEVASLHWIINHEDWDCTGIQELYDTYEDPISFMMKYHFNEFSPEALWETLKKVLNTTFCGYSFEYIHNNDGIADVFMDEVLDTFAFFA